MLGIALRIIFFEYQDGGFARNINLAVLIELELSSPF